VPRGGKRAGAGNRQHVVGARGWLRSVCDDPEFRELVVKAIRSDLTEGRTESYFKALEHGIGRPPQALDVRTANTDADGQLIYRACFEDGLSVGDVLPAQSPTLPASLLGGQEP
jgi:hypothetical protein